MPFSYIDSLRDFALIVRRLWAGERVSYDGPAGRFPDLVLEDRAWNGLLEGLRGPDLMGVVDAIDRGLGRDPLLEGELVISGARGTCSEHPQDGQDGSGAAHRGPPPGAQNADSASRVLHEGSLMVPSILFFFPYVHLSAFS